VKLPVNPPVKPMLAKLSRSLPQRDDVLYEPKWDGFRCIVFRDGDEVELGSRNERPMSRYFPEVCEAVRRELPERCVVDGELVIAGESGLDFDSLQLRIHPAESRIKKLAAEIPASFVAFDLLALGAEDLRSIPLGERRSRLESGLAGVQPPVYVTPATRSPEVAADWFSRFEGAGLDGVVVKPLGLPYCEDQRVLQKVKHERTADCVVAGFRWHKSGGVIGSLLLGLYDSAGVLHHVGVIGAFPMATRRSLVEELAPWRMESLEGHPWATWIEHQQEGAASGQRMPGGWSRWNAKKDLSFEPLRPDRVVEVAYEHMQGDRFRHAAQFRRWRPDKDPLSCTYDQLDTAVPELLSSVFGA
jgi:ATP-dependent DNA ligase